MKELNLLYKNRFTEREYWEKKSVWYVITIFFFQKYISEEDVVLDVGAGYCEFINAVRAKKKIALDINKDVKEFANFDVEVVLNDCTNMCDIKSESIDVVFVSNLLEHMKDTDAIEQTLKECKRVLKEKGKLLILQPNIKYAYKEYWDFFDHITPLSHKSLVEALKKVGFTIVEVKPKFLPYSSKSVKRVPKFGVFIKIYLKSRLLQRMFGKQMFIVAQRVKD